MGPFFFDSDSLQAEASVSSKYEQTRHVFGKKHANMQGCLPWIFAPNDVKVRHCDHTFELRLQESSLLLHQEGQGRRSSLIRCFESSY